MSAIGKSHLWTKEHNRRRRLEEATREAVGKFVEAKNWKLGDNIFIVLEFSIREVADSVDLDGILGRARAPQKVGEKLAGKLERDEVDQLLHFYNSLTRQFGEQFYHYHIRRAMAAELGIDETKFEYLMRSLLELDSSQYFL
ncbi:MAG: hypothetical protein EA369_09840 [Bradymonadales bacterium]|nr:MAG: hypothetical protein EA369_09840 [Bradymonadales bacterium]